MSELFESIVTTNGDGSKNRVYKSILVDVYVKALKEREVIAIDALEEISRLFSDCNGFKEMGDRSYKVKELVENKLKLLRGKIASTKD